jgi:hypothetical protein
MRLNRRHSLIALAGLAALVVLVADPGDSKAPLAAVEPRASVAPSPAKAAGPGPFAQLPQRRGFSESRGDMFAARSWAPPPPPPPPPQQAQPVPPPNPYRFAGTVIHDGKLKMFVTDGDRAYEVRQGDELDKGYRVESVNREAIVLVYVPLGTQHSIEASSLLTPPSAPAQRVAGVADPGAATGAGR